MLRLSYLGSIAIFFLAAIVSVLHAQEETQTFDSEASAEAAGWIFNDEGQSDDRYDEDEIQENRCSEDEPCRTDLGWKDCKKV